MSPESHTYHKDHHHCQDLRCEAKAPYKRPSRAKAEVAKPDTAASEARQHHKDLEQSYKVLKDQYSELARAIGVEGDAFWGDPLVGHDGVMAKAKLLKDTLKVFLEARP